MISCDHSWRFVKGTASYRRVVAERADVCQRKNRLICTLCDFVLLVPCGAAREDVCGPCGARHNQRVKRVVFSGLSVEEVERGASVVTLTAPGESMGGQRADAGFPACTPMLYDRTKCQHGGRCRGKETGCVVERMTAATWNGYLGQAWSYFATELRRILPTVTVEYLKATEPQDRGVAHLHVVVRHPGVSPEALNVAVQSALKHTYAHPLVPGFVFGWGHQFTVRPIVVEAEPNSLRLAVLRAVRYIAKYVTKGGKGLVTLNRFTGEVKTESRGLRTWTASGGYGCSMQAVREAQRTWAAAAAGQGVARPAGGAPPTGADAAGAAGALEPNEDCYGTCAVEMLLRDLLGAVSV